MSKIESVGDSTHWLEADEPPILPWWRIDNRLGVTRSITDLDALLFPLDREARHSVGAADEASEDVVEKGAR
jgi:hypothetical protein